MQHNECDSVDNTLSYLSKLDLILTQMALYIQPKGNVAGGLSFEHERITPSKESGHFHFPFNVSVSTALQLFYPLFIHQLSYTR